MVLHQNKTANSGQMRPYRKKSLMEGGYRIVLRFHNGHDRTEVDIFKLIKILKRYGVEKLAYKVKSGFIQRIMNCRLVQE